MLKFDLSEESKSELEMKCQEMRLGLSKDLEVDNIAISIPQIQNNITICWAQPTKEFMDYLQRFFRNRLRVLLKNIGYNT